MLKYVFSNHDCQLFLSFLINFRETNNFCKYPLLCICKYPLLCICKYSLLCICKYPLLCICKYPLVPSLTSITINLPCICALSTAQIFLLEFVRLFVSISRLGYSRSLQVLQAWLCSVSVHVSKTGLEKTFTFF